MEVSDVEDVFGRNILVKASYHSLVIGNTAPESGLRNKSAPYWDLTVLQAKGRKKKRERPI